MFSYGSGLAATMYSLEVKGSVSHIAEKVNLSDRLSKRIAVSAQDYSNVIISFVYVG
jgi:hydroxymethylglutaryl-CoA synthase